MELNDFDQAPIAGSTGQQVLLRTSLVGVAPDPPVAAMAMATPVEHWLDGGWQELQIEARHTLGAAQLSTLHRDPFDRLLVGQATADGLLLITADSHLAAYPGRCG